MAVARHFREFYGHAGAARRGRAESGGAWDCGSVERLRGPRLPERGPAKLSLKVAKPTARTPATLGHSRVALALSLAATRSRVSCAAALGRCPGEPAEVPRRATTRRRHRRRKVGASVSPSVTPETESPPRLQGGPGRPPSRTEPHRAALHLKRRIAAIAWHRRQS